MERVAILGGQVMAHAVWAIREGATLTPIGTKQNARGENTSERFGVASSPEAALRVHAFLASAKTDSSCAVVVLDAFVKVEDRDVDALVMTLVEYGTPDRSFQVIVPYRPHAKGFSVQRPQLTGLDGDPEALNALSELFWKGVQSNPKGARTWNEHLAAESAS